MELKPEYRIVVCPIGNGIVAQPFKIDGYRQASASVEWFADRASLDASLSRLLDVAVELELPPELEPDF